MTGRRAIPSARTIRCAAGVSSRSTTRSAPLDECARAGLGEELPDMSATDEILAPAPYQADSVFSSDAQSLGSLTVEQDAISPSGERLMTLNMGPQHPS